MIVAPADLVGEVYRILLRTQATHKRKLQTLDPEAYRNLKPETLRSSAPKPDTRVQTSHSETGNRIASQGTAAF